MTQAAAVGIRRAREYETIYVLRADVDPDGADRVATRVADVVERENGKLVKVETWGRRKLAYPVQKQIRGIYYYIKYLGQGGLVAELERNLRMLDTVMKFQTVALRQEVEIESVEVDPEEIKFARLEISDEEEVEESRESALGLVEPPSRPSRPEGERASEPQAADSATGDEDGDAAEGDEEEAADQEEETE